MVYCGEMRVRIVHSSDDRNIYMVYNANMSLGYYLNWLVNLPVSSEYSQHWWWQNHVFFGNYFTSQCPACTPQLCITITMNKSDSVSFYRTEHFTPNHSEWLWLHLNHLIIQEFWNVVCLWITVYLQLIRRSKVFCSGSSLTLNVTLWVLIRAWESF